MVRTHRHSRNGSSYRFPDQSSHPSPTSRSWRMRGGGGGERRGGGMRAFNPTSIIDNSWTDLTFSLKVDDETLIKARPVYQKHRDNLQKTLKEARESGDQGGLREVFGKIGSEFQEDLKSVLTEEQIAELNTLQQKRMQQMMNRGSGRRGGGNRGR